jgi:hypothetical protein
MRGCLLDNTHIPKNFFFRTLTTDYLMQEIHTDTCIRLRWRMRNKGSMGIKAPVNRLLKQKKLGC